MPRYLTFSGQHNAWALAQGLGRLGHGLETWSDRRGWVTSASRPPEPGDVLFFTDEQSLMKHLARSDTYRFLPRILDAHLADDKLEWARAITGLGDVPVPFWEVPVSGPVVAPELPVYLKARHSWSESRKMPRGYICRSAADVGRALEQLTADGWERSQFFWQRLIAGPITNNYSVCGFADATDPARSAMLVVRKVLGDGPTVMSCGAVVETVRDPASLLSRAARLVGALNYTGPFELEFLRDPSSDQYYLLELNPRFWMQHGLFIDGYDNVVISRYMGLETPAFPDGLPFRSLTWINTVDFLYRVPELLRSDVDRRRVYLDAWRRQRAGQTSIIWSPGVIVTLKMMVSGRARAIGLRLRRLFTRAASR